ncbi:MAG: ABC-2 family transporter protein [Devosia sp.]|uniref:ABC transporter permease n=1 Tax=Devosia sp. TaxID=1871048 RepID=UPI0024C86CD1|nr:ABC-2 family transporter protein [Devosia sp.]UYO01007.1 MAG: ABC-2 family transporter protein [Devosia sp.]
MRALSYPAFTATAFQSRLAYRNQVWANAFGDLVNIFARIALWTAAYAGMATVDGVTLPEMVTYAVLVGSLLRWDHSQLLHDIGDAVRTGDVSIYLLRPLHYPLAVMASHVGHYVFELVTIVLPVVIIVGLTVGVLPPASLFHGVMFVAYWINSWLIMFCLAAICGLLAFWLLTAFSLEWFLTGILLLASGLVVPMWFLPPALAASFSYLPFAWGFYYPAAVYLGKLDPMASVLHLGIGIGWLAILALCLAWLWSKARHRMIVQGG